MTLALDIAEKEQEEDNEEFACIIFEVRASLRRIIQVCNESIECMREIHCDASQHNFATSSSRLGLAGVGVAGGCCLLAAPFSGGTSLVTGGVACTSVAAVGAIGALVGDQVRTNYDFEARFWECEDQLRTLEMQLGIQLSVLIEKLESRCKGIDGSTASAVRFFLGYGTPASQEGATRALALGSGAAGATVAGEDTGARSAQHAPAIAAGETGSHQTATAAVAVPGESAAAHAATHGAAGGTAVATASSGVATTSVLSAVGGTLSLVSGSVEGGLALYNLSNGHPSQHKAAEYIRRLQDCKLKCLGLGESIALLTVS